MGEMELMQWVERLRAAMFADPKHHLPWQERQAFYEALGDDKEAQRFCGWLAILSAQRVLPIALKETPWDSDVLQTIAAATKFLRGQGYPDIDEISIDIENVKEWTYFFKEYNTLANQSKLRRTIIAHSAALKALYTVSNKISLSFPPIDERTIDEDFAILVAVGDSAGAAAVAFALVDDETCSPELLQDFWEWWLIKAVPRAKILAAAKQLY